MDELEKEKLEYIESLGTSFVFDTTIGEYIFAPDANRTFRAHEMDWVLEELRDLNMQLSFEIADVSISSPCVFTENFKATTDKESTACS